MDCTKNPKTTFFGLIKYNGPHRYKKRVSHWSFEMFQINGTCEACGLSYHDFGIEWKEMLERGYDSNFIRDMRFHRWGMTEDEWREKLAKGEKI